MVVHTYIIHVYCLRIFKMISLSSYDILAVTLLLCHCLRLHLHSVNFYLSCSSEILLFLLLAALSIAYLHIYVDYLLKALNTYLIPLHRMHPRIINCILSVVPLTCYWTQLALMTAGQILFVFIVLELMLLDFKILLNM